ncbi:MAG: hypothetical protein IJL57_00115 [Bacteroidales bacterium]|nr:hypothetical protein [Bacteroidales bacterium]
MMNIFRQIVLFVGILLMGCALQAQNVEFIADWHPGDVFKYNVSKIVQKDNAIDTLNYTMLMTVVDSTEEKYHIKMVYDGLYNNPILDTLLDGKLSFKDYEILQTVYYSTNNVGEVIEIENADTLIKSIFKYTDALMSATGDDAADKVMSTLKSLYNKEYLLSSVYKEISLIHSVLGYSYPLNKPIKAKVKVENTLTGGFFDAKTFVAIEEFDPERQFCRIRVNTEYDSKQLGKAVVDLLKSFGMDKKELKQSRFRLSKVDEEVYEYLAYPGILLHADFSRGTMLTSSTEAPSGKIERYIITLNQP